MSHVGIHSVCQELSPATTAPSAAANARAVVATAAGAVHAGHMAPTTTVIGAAARATRSRTSVGFSVDFQSASGVERCNVLAFRREVQRGSVVRARDFANSP